MTTWRSVRQVRPNLNNAQMIAATKQVTNNLPRHAPHPTTHKSNSHKFIWTNSQHIPHKQNKQQQQTIYDFCWQEKIKFEINFWKKKITKIGKNILKSLFLEIAGNEINE